MFYNTNTNSLISNVPTIGYLNDGTLVQGLDVANTEIQKLCGILPIKSDTPEQPSGTLEDTTQRQIIIEEDGVIVIRTWISPSAPSVPENISPRQIRLWLIENGITMSTIDNAINSISDELLRNKTKIEWEFSPYIERNHPMINTIGQVLNLSSEQIDTAFIQASQL